MRQPRPWLTPAVVLAAALSACVVGPDYRRPKVETPPAYKELDGWKQAAPADALDRGEWWALFEDPVLNALEAKVEVSNQNLAAAEAAYRQARYFVVEQRAAYFPVINLAGAVNQSGGGGGRQASVSTGTGGTVVAGGGGGGTAAHYQVTVGATWAPDLWGRVRRSVENAKALAQASAAEVASARLSAQTELASDYLQLRATDEQIRLLDQTATNFASLLRVTRNRYDAGVAARADVLTAQGQLNNAQAQSVALQQTRAQFEHAIAVLIGVPPATFKIAPTPFNPVIPDIPVGVPSTLLERRPDVATAERQARAANATIGVQEAAYFPTLTLSTAGGVSAPSFVGLFNSSATTWSLGANALETVFNGGARWARVREARAAYEQSVATYRQTVLTAFQNVEDALVAGRVLEQEVALRHEASAVFDRVETITGNQYRAGTAAYTDVVVAQDTALSARINLIQARQSQLVAVVSLVEALGGGWSTAELRGK